MSWFNRSQQHHIQDTMAALGRSLALIEFSPDGLILSANENFCATLGYAQSEIVGRHHRIFVDADYAKSPEYQAFWRKLQGGVFEAAQFRRLRKDGSPVYIQASYNPILDAHGRVVSVVKAATDITAVKRQALKNEAKMKALSLVQAIIEFKPNGEIIVANDNFFAVMGYRREDVIGRHHRMFVDPVYADSPEYGEFWRKLNSGQPIVDSFRRVGHGGKPILLQAAYSPVIDACGKVYKSLISTSGADVEAGVKLVRQTGQSLGQIVAKVAEINALARDIAAGAEEQNAALAEVNAAVSQMDQSTQQNAAMAEEANAAVESMKQQILRLADAVSQFKLSDAAPRRAEASRAAPGAAASARRRVA